MIPAVAPVTRHHPAACLSVTITMLLERKLCHNTVTDHAGKVWSHGVLDELIRAGVFCTVTTVQCLPYIRQHT